MERISIHLAVCASNLYDIGSSGKDGCKDENMQLDYEFLSEIFYILMAYACVIYKQNILDAIHRILTKSFGSGYFVADNHFDLCSEDIHDFFRRP